MGFQSCTKTGRISYIAPKNLLSFFQQTRQSFFTPNRKELRIESLNIILSVSRACFTSKYFFFQIFVPLLCIPSSGFQRLVLLALCHIPTLKTICSLYNISPNRFIVFPYLPSQGDYKNIIYPTIISLNLEKYANKHAS